MNKNLFEMIFWDFDGVIKESISVKTDAFQELFKPYGKDLCNKIKMHHIENSGISRFDKIPLYLKWSGIEPTKSIVENTCSKFSKIVKNKVINSPWVPGVRVFLQKNKEKFIFIIVSATPKDELIDICKSINIYNYFYEIYGSPTSKSNAIKKSIINYNISPEKCLMIGDARVDIDAAKENNINFILRKHKYNRDLKINHFYSTINDFKSNMNFI